MKWRIQKGQTLIELLIAAAVISSGLFAAATIVFSNLQLSNRDADAVVAVNLAREGIELAKEKRDANWLAGDPFDAGFLLGADDYTATSQWDGGSASAVTFDFTADDIDGANTVVRQSADVSTPGFFTQVDPSATVTPWRRLITFHPICETSSGLTFKNDGETCDVDLKVGIRVESHVRWARKGMTFNRIVYEDLFDWR